MPCYFFSAGESGFNPSSSGYATEADCLNACEEGACCEGETCSIKPQCQCQGEGQAFRGAGTVCSPNLCKGPNCPCARFNKCTVTLTYEEITVVDLHERLGNYPFRKEAGTFFGTRNGLSNSQTFLGQRFIPFADTNCTGNPRGIGGNCSTDPVNEVWHLAIVYGRGGLSETNRFSYYRYNVAADPDQPCPASVAGLDVTVSEVLRDPAGGLSVPNLPLEQCQLTCKQIMSEFTEPFNPSFSFYWSNIVWLAENQTVILPQPGAVDPIYGPIISPTPDGTDWVCDLPIWGMSTPTVSVVCPP